MIHDRVFLEFRLATRYSLRSAWWQKGYLGSYGQEAPATWSEHCRDEYAAGMRARGEDDDLDEEKQR